MLKQVLFFPWNSNWLMLGAVAASVACSMLGAVVGRTAALRSCCPALVPLAPFSHSRGPFSCPILAYQGASVAVYAVVVVPNAVAAAAAGSAVAAAAAAYAA